MRSVRVSRQFAASLASVALLSVAATWASPTRAAVAPPAGCAAYRFTDVGVLGGLDSRAYAVSRSGVVAGLADTSPGSGLRAFHAFRWMPRHPGGTAGIIQDLGALGEGERSGAFGVNARGLTVGVSLPANGGSKAFVYDGSMHQLPSPRGSAEAAAVDDRGRVAGQARARDGDNHAVLWLPRHAGGTRHQYRLVDLGVPRGRVSSSATALSTRGQVAGAVGDADYYAYAALWTPAHPHGTTGRWTELGVLPGGDGSVARDVNRQGTVVGQSTSAHGDRGFVFDGRLRTLSTLPGGTESFAYAVDDHGLIVGYADGAGTNGDRAVLWRNRRPVDLNSYLPARARAAGYLLTGAYDINNRGQIVGVAIISGHAHGFLLTPRGHPSGQTTRPASFCQFS